MPIVSAALIGPVALIAAAVQNVADKILSESRYDRHRYDP